MYGTSVGSPSIDAFNGELHVTYYHVNFEDDSIAIMYMSAHYPKLFVVIPGINDHGKMMMERANFMFSHDDDSFVSICEQDRRHKDQVCHLVNPSAEQVRQKIRNATTKAKEKRINVVVLIDMDLENYTWEFPLPPLINRWYRSVKWAGEMANIVSKAFNKEIPAGRRMLYAHSAGGDATYQSVLRSQKPMYDNINILNGRTSAVNLRNALRSRGCDWRQVKVFTNNGDLPASPELPLPRFLRLLLEIFWKASISNYDAARRYAGDAWVHLHCGDTDCNGDTPGNCNCPCGKECSFIPLPCESCSHNGLRDCINGVGIFKANTRTRQCVEGSVEDMMRKWTGKN